MPQPCQRCCSICRKTAGGGYAVNLGADARTLRFKPSWVQPQIGAGDACFDLYPEESIEKWRRRNGVWVD